MGRVVKKAFSVLGFIGQNIECRNWDILLKLYKTLVRPHLEYCVQFWSPYYRKGIIKLERVQKRFIRMLPGLESLSYKERLNRLGLFSLERRRLRGDLIEVFKIMRGIDKVDNQHLFPKVGERGEIQKCPEGQFFHTERGVCLEQAARGSSRGGYNFVF